MGLTNSKNGRMSVRSYSFPKSGFQLKRVGKFKRCTNANKRLHILLFRYANNKELTNLKRLHPLLQGFGKFKNDTTKMNADRYL